jgi:hypothetical protein
MDHHSLRMMLCCSSIASQAAGLTRSGVLMEAVGSAVVLQPKRRISAFSAKMCSEQYRFLMRIHIIQILLIAQSRHPYFSTRQMVKCSADLTACLKVVDDGGEEQR